MNHRPSKKVINSKLAEFEQYRECYQGLLEPVKEEFSQQNQFYKKWILRGIILTLACLVVVLGWIYFENQAAFNWRVKDKNKVDTIVFVTTPIGLLIGLTTVGVLLRVRQDELRNTFLSSLVRNINGDLRYIKKEEHDLNKTEFEHVFDKQKMLTSSMARTNSPSYFISDEMKSHSFSLYYLSTYSYECYFFVVVPLKDTFSSLSDSVMNYVERFKKEYNYEIKVSIMNQKAYFLVEAPESFFSKRRIAIKDTDDESLYHLYCMIKLGEEIANL